jgi:hypothetical protein
MTKIKTTVYIYWHKYEWEDEPEYRVYSFKIDDDECTVFLYETEMEIEVDKNFDPRLAQVAALNKKMEKARADFQATVTSIQARINELLAIEN